MRDRSGRSGRRRGSQKPGTACGAASTFGADCGARALWARASVTAAARTTAKAAAGKRRQNGKAVKKVIAWQVVRDSRLIDHPGGEARAERIKNRSPRGSV